MRLAALLLFTLPVLLSAEVLRLDGVDFHYRVPRRHDANSRILILFGGRNWTGDKTLKRFGFDALADRHGLLLLSPSFRDRNYWEPETWSGELLKKAVRQLENRYRLKPQKLYFYGYSAGGQCAALFSQWMPEQVAAWGVHGCGVYPETIKSAQASVLITCGVDDEARLPISRGFVYRYREHGGLLLWKYFPNSGHELSSSALELAKTWFDDLLSDREVIEYGEDDTLRVPSKVDIEFRNPLYSEKLKELWRK